MCHVARLQRHKLFSSDKESERDAEEEIGSAVVPSCRSSPFNKGCVTSGYADQEAASLIPQSTGLSASGRRGFYPQIRTVVVFPEMVADRVVVAGGVTGRIYIASAAHLTRRFAQSPRPARLGGCIYSTLFGRTGDLVMFGKGVWRFDKIPAALSAA